MDSEYSKQIEQLYLEMYDMLLLYAQCSFQEAALAEEAVQETFRIACQRPEQLCENPNPKGWLVNTLKFTICNKKRERERARKLLAVYLAEQKSRAAISEDTLPVQLMYGDLADSEDFQLIKEMAIDGRSHLEMANARGISVSACKKRVQRAKERLQEKLTQDVTK